jgi:hypothetical protein
VSQPHPTYIFSLTRNVQEEEEEKKQKEGRIHPFVSLLALQHGCQKSLHLQLWPKKNAKKFLTPQKITVTH